MKLTALIASAGTWWRVAGKLAGAGALSAVSVLAFAQQTCPAGLTQSQPTGDYDLTQNEGGTVTHTKTGLTWMRCSFGQTWNGSACIGIATIQTWQSALQAARNDKTYGGGWRLPSINELRSIVEDACVSPSVNTAVFPETLSANYRSSSTYTWTPTYAWYVDFNFGRDYSNANLKTETDSYYVRLVRDGQLSGDFDLFPAAGITGVESRKNHGSAGVFGLPIDTMQPIGGLVTVESRAIGGGHTLVFQFDGTVNAPGVATVTPPSTAMATASGSEVRVTLTNVPDKQRVTVTLTNVNGALSPSPVSLGFLVGDVNNSRSVDPTDIGAIKARSGQVTDLTNFKFDLNSTGVIGAADISAVKIRSGFALLP